MNSDLASAMDMPPCDVLAMLMAERGELFHIESESRPKDNCEQELARIVVQQSASARPLMQIFQAAA
jgi:hypothetical protein